MTKTILPILGVAFFAISSCCTKKMCLNNNIEIAFYGYTFADVDTIYDIRNGDTTLAEAHTNTHTSDTSHSYSVSPNAGKYEGTIHIWVPGANKSFILTDFTYRKENCNDCFPPGYDKFDYFSGCNVNGERNNGSTIEVYK